MLPWDEMLRAALAAGVSAAEFWSLSLKEWRWMAGGGDGGMKPRDLAGLMEEFPDKGQ
jgi:hypothetical protein